MYDLITEEDEVVYNSEQDLSYQLYEEDYIELYVDDFYVGKCEIWYDAGMDYRHYIILNYIIIYLDSINLK